MNNEKIKLKIKQIALDKNSGIDGRIYNLTGLYKEIEKNDELVLTLDNAIEDVFGEKLRELNDIKEQNLDTVNIEDIKKLKEGFALLFDLIDNTLDWNSEKKDDLEGVINRASLRALLIDPEVSYKTREEVMNNWEDFM